MTHEMYAFILAHGPATVAFLLFAIPTLITGLTPYPKEAGFVAGLQIILNLLSLVSHHDSPGTFKLPLTVSAHPDSTTGRVVDLPPPPHGFAHVWVLILLVAVSLLAMPVMAQAAPPSTPTRTFGGCNKLGTFCAQPSGLITLTGYNLTTHEVVASFSPGLGYGFTIHPNDWYAFGLDAFVSMQVKTDASPQHVGFSLVGKFANYLRIGINRDRLGDKASWIVPIGLGLDISL